MNTNKVSSNSEARAEQAASRACDTIKLGIDWHAEQSRVVRMIDQAGPEPAQRLRPADFLVSTRWREPATTRLLSFHPFTQNSVMQQFAGLDV